MPLPIRRIINAGSVGNRATATPMPPMWCMTRPPAASRSARCPTTWSAPAARFSRQGCRRCSPGACAKASSTPSAPTTPATCVSADGTLGTGERAAGDLELYEAIQRDLRQLGRVDTLFVLGDLIGPARDANALLDRLQDPRRGELAPQCLYGWWEDQLLAERGYRGERRAEPLRQQFGQAAVEALQQAVDPGRMAWLPPCSSLHRARLRPAARQLGRCGRPPGAGKLTAVAVGSAYTDGCEPPVHRPQRRAVLRGALGWGIASAVRDLEGERQRQQVVPQRKVIGIGSGFRYTLYDPGSDRIAFRTLGQQAGSRRRGFA